MRTVIAIRVTANISYYSTVIFGQVRSGQRSNSSQRSRQVSGAFPDPILLLLVHLPQQLLDPVRDLLLESETNPAHYLQVFVTHMRLENEEQAAEERE